MQSQTLDKQLQLLDFETDSSASGLLFTDRDYKDDANVSFDEILILHQAKGLRAKAVYFRRIRKRSVPQLFIFDNSDNKLLPQELADIHIKIWSSGIIPLYYVFDKTEVKIFDCRKPVNKRTLKAKEMDSLPFEEDSLLFTAKIHAKYKKYKKYSALLFQNGSFWESQENRNRFKANSSSYNKLIDGLKRIRKEFSKGQNETICNKLLVLSILVKYLEERKDSSGNRVLPREYFNKFEGADSFCDVLRRKGCLDLFEDLARDVNGRIFKLDKQEKGEIRKLDQSKLADFLDARLDRQQYVFWNLYDFNYLPVELISRIYEEFIPKRKDITYTPAHLVNFMVDECMPVTSPKKELKLIDVSCGSGIFLVAAFKRLVQWWQQEQYEKTGNIESPKIKKLKSILTKSIHGVDIEPEAVRLTVFSLTVALCDMLDPTIMWKQLTEEKLVDLNDNIITQDFFGFLKTNKKFDLIIGNPPFNPPEEEKGRYWRELSAKVEFDFEVPDTNIALAFLQQAMKLLKKEGLLSLVIPSGPLLYNDTIKYRRAFLESYNVPQIFDFSSLSGVLFEGRNYPVVVIFAQNTPPDDNDILHVAVRRTRTAKEKLYFEIDKYDLYYVSMQLAKEEQLIWKANVLGSGHLFYFLKRLQDSRTLEKYLSDKQEGGWEVAEGYKVAGEASKKPEKAPWLTGKSWIPTEKFTDDHINEIDITVETAKLFERSCKTKKCIFEGPHVLVKERPTLPIVFREEYLIFRNEIIGIYAPESQRGELLELAQNIIANRRLYKMLLLSMSGRAGISRSTSTILKKDIMALPYPENLNVLKMSKAEKIVIDDVLEYGIDQLRQAEEADVNTKDAGKRTLTDFARVFCTSLNSVYKENTKRFYPLEPIESVSFICFPFAYGNPDRPKIIPEANRTQIEKGNMESLIDNKQGTNILYKRIIKQYHKDHKDMVYLIKPKLLRYWLKSIALRDANEVFNDLVSSGY
ncbi:class I SAM-dependent DNA methyltransferase [Planctomycetota bacterium]